MIRMNLVLLCAVVVSAFYLVHTQYESRRLYTALDRAHAQTRKLDAEHEQLQVLKREQAAPARVQQLATKQLQMRPASPGITQYVTVFEPQAPAMGAVQEARP
ncbi:cell division protein FtsL [Hydrogenophaga sp.]|uniref:cell division protein FtsL n=1 Tax=Hydrogenophaga sp. TaxID=1904254 RepID=UPI0035655E80